MSADFCPAYGLCDSVKSIDGNTLTLTNSFQELDLCNQLSEAPGKYTRLMLSTGVGYEHFKVVCVGGCLKLDPAPQSNYVSGDKVWFESCHKDNVADILACLAEEEAGEDGTGGFPKLPGYTLQQNDNGEWCYVAEEGKQEAFEVQVGKTILCVDKDGCVTKKPAEAGSFPEDGEYTYATVTVNGCKITSIKNGTKPVSGSCGSCCGNCAQEVTNAEVV